MPSIKSNIEVIIREVKAIVKKDGTLWSAMVNHAVVDFSGYEIDIKQLKDLIKDEERTVKESTKVSLQDCASYRSSKSIICRAIENNIPLRETDGTVRGKTEVEKDLKNLKEKETPFETIKRVSALLSKKIKEMQAEQNVNEIDVSMAFTLVQGNFKEVTELAGSKLSKAS